MKKLTKKQRLIVQQVYDKWIDPKHQYTSSFLDCPFCIAAGVTSLYSAAFLGGCERCAVAQFLPKHHNSTMCLDLPALKAVEEAREAMVRAKEGVIDFLNNILNTE